MNILIRTAGGRAPKKELGFGHISRSLNLAHFLKPHKIIYLLEDYGGSRKIIQQKGYKYYLIKKNVGLNTDIYKTFSLIKKYDIDILIIDKFNVSTQYVKRMKEKSKVVLITDLKKINYKCDLIANGFIGYKNQIKINKYGSKCLLGPKYQILNSDFSKQKRSRKIFDVLISFGGYDENNITVKVLRVLNKFQNQIKAKIILGPLTKKPSSIIILEKKIPQNFIIIKSTSNMKNEIVSSKFGICNGGITSYEFASQKIPFLVICQTKHQLITAKEWEKLGYGINLGMPTINSLRKLKKIFLDIHHKKIPLTIPKKNIVDGLGGKRVAKEIISLARCQK